MPSQLILVEGLVNWLIAEIDIVLVSAFQKVRNLRERKSAVMKAYIVSQEVKISPLGDYARCCLIGNKPVEQLQVKTLRALGLESVFITHRFEITDYEEHIILNDNLYFSEELLREFISRSRQARVATVCALKRGEITLRTAVSVQDVAIHQDHVEYGLYYLPDSTSDDAHQAIVIDPDALHAAIAMPSHMCDSNRYEIPVTDKFVIQIDHWVNLWIANIVAALEVGAQLGNSSRLKQLFLAIKAHSFNQWRILRRMNIVGDNYDIHPTAYIEGSVVGSNVSLGAGSIIRNSVIGDNVSIGNGVVVEQSVVGDNCVILNGRLIFSVFYPGTFSVAEMVTASFVGSESFIGLNSTMTDFRLDGQNVSVLKDGRLVDSSQRFLGACLGHGVYLGSGCIVAPGRSIPCGFRLALSEDRVVRKQLGGDHAIEGYRLVKKIRS